MFASALFLEHDTPVAVQGPYKLSYSRQSSESLRKIVGRSENLYSELAEWPIAPPWKGDDLKRSESSNLSLTASFRMLTANKNFYWKKAKQHPVILCTGTRATNGSDCKSVDSWV